MALWMRSLLEPLVTSDLERALPVVARRTADLLGMAQCSIFLYHPDEGTLAVAAACGLSGPLSMDLKETAFPLAGLPSWVRRMLERGECVMMPSAGVAEMPASGSEAHLPAREGRELPWNARPVLAVPLIASRKVLGAMFLANEVGSRAPDVLRETAELIAAALGPAAALARARAEESKQLDLRNIGLALGTGLPVDDTLQMVAQMTAELMDAQLCLVLTLQEENRLLHVRAASRHGIAELRASASLDENSLIARVIETGLPAWAEDNVAPPQLSPRHLGERFAVRSGLALPIRDGSRITGVIMVYHEQPRVYPAGEVQVLAAIAARAGAAIRNAAHYEQQKEVAETIRRSLAPQLPRSVPGMEWGQAYMPRQDHIGGDLYDIAPLPGGRYGIMIGDVSGNGLRAAIHTAMGKYMVRAFGLESLRPGWVLGRVNDAVCAQSRSEIFLTLFYAVLYPTGRLVYANGGHSYPILVREGHRLLSLETTGTVVGMLPGEKYQDRTERMRPGDLLVLHTDGITEAERHGERFGLERLEAIIRRWEGQHPQDLADHIVRCAREFAGGRLQDDAAVLVIRKTPQA